MLSLTNISSNTLLGRIIIRNTLILLVIVLLESCTMQLWENDFYFEKVSGIYISEKKNIFIAIGSKYTYFFEVKKQLIDILKIKSEIRLRPNFNNFKVDSINSISGKLTLNLELKELNLNTINSYKKSGFKIGPKKTLIYIERLNGNRTKTDLNVKNIVNFDNPYLVKIYKPLDFEEMATKVLITPFTLVADAGLVVLTIVGTIIGPVIEVIPKM